MKRFLLVLSMLSFLFSLPSKAQVHIHIRGQVGGPSYGNGAAIGYITACAGTASVSPAIQQFTVSGNELTSDMVITAPGYFELSLSPTGGYQGSVFLSPTNGTINNTIIYARSSSSAPPGNISDRCFISTSGIVSMDPILTATIYTPPTIGKVANQTLFNGTSTTAINFTGTANTFTWVNDTPGIGLAASGTGNIPSFTAINTGSIPVTATITATPVNAGFAYITNSGNNNVSVINTLTNSAVATINTGTNPTGLSVSPNNRRVYVANESSNTVSVINSSTYAVIATIPVGLSPIGILASLDSTKLYVANQQSNTVSLIDAIAYKVVSTIKVGSNPYGLAESAGAAAVYVTNGGSNTVSVIDGGSDVVTATIPVGENPTGIAVSPDGSRLYVANFNSNTVTVINTRDNSFVYTTPVGLNPYGVAVSPDGSQLYVANYGSADISVINTSTNSVTSTVNVGTDPVGVSVSPDGSELFVVNWGSKNVSVINTSTNTVSASVNVGAAPYSMGNFIKGGTGCSGNPVAFTITVEQTTVPVITGAGNLSPLNTIYGTASSSTIFTVSGVTMAAGILVSPPPGFEVSADDIAFSKTVTVGSPGTIAATTVYIRLASTTPVGIYSGNIVLSSSGAANVNLAMPASTVTPAPLTITADNKSKFYGMPNPVLTVTYLGFVNGDKPAQLTTQPTVSTTAVTASPVGQYVITVIGAASPNYNITPVSGVLTINPSVAIVIPNTFTPNGDGINDTWDIKNLDNYVNCIVQVYNRYGENVYSSIGYGVAWDGTYRGAALPTSTYYYIINLKNGSKALSGFVAIIR